MHYDVAIIGAGMSGLAAGIRLAYFDKSVCIFEKHYAYGGLNSYYRLNGRDYDVGLHAVTNYCRPGDKGAPLSKLLRQLRLTREDFDLREQNYSEIRFRDVALRCTNDVKVLVGQVAEQFPSEADRFARFVDFVRSYNDSRLDVAYTATRPMLRDRLRDPLLIEMLLCPIMYYGSAQEYDLDFTQFVTLFKSILVEGMARPRDGVRRIIKALVRKYRACGGELRMRCGVERLHVEGGRVAAIILDSGETITADKVLSCAGYRETMDFCDGPGLPIDKRQSTIDNPPGRLSFVETVAALDCAPADLGHDGTIVFFNDEDRFTYARPHGLVDLRSGVFCCPSNYQGHEHVEGSLRLTWLANYEEWSRLSEADYAAAKRRLHVDFIARAERFIPVIADHVVCTDMFTPVTIRRYTGHLAGAVYGSPKKRRDGRTPLENLFICGTDQGYLGIIGAMLSGITIANLHLLRTD